MTFDATPPEPPRAPIGALRLGTIAMAGVIVALAVPAASAAFAMSTQVNDNQEPVAVNVPGPVSRVVISDSVSDVRITGDPAATGVTGQAVLQWKSDGRRPVLKQSFAGGVLTLTKDCSGSCGPVDLTLTVPAGISLRATTSDGDIGISGITGQVDLASSNGSVEAGGLGAQNASFASTNGNIDASFVGAPARITARTTNGSVTVNTDGRTPYYDSVTCTGGNQDLTNPQELRAVDEIDATTTNGDVTIR